jgi:hypothetical protein
MEETIGKMKPKWVNKWLNSLTFGGADDDVICNHISKAG